MACSVYRHFPTSSITNLSDAGSTSLKRHYHNDRYAFDSDDRPLDFIAAIRAEKEYFEEQMAQRV